MAVCTSVNPRSLSEHCKLGRDHNDGPYHEGIYGARWFNGRWSWERAIGQGLAVDTPVGLVTVQEFRALCRQNGGKPPEYEWAGGVFVLEGYRYVWRSYDEPQPAEPAVPEIPPELPAPVLERPRWKPGQQTLWGSM